RLARRKHGRVVEELEAVVRRAARREALLREAQEELARADGVGETGRFTEQELEGFRLGRVLGRGGMGEVYEATGPEGEAAAVKLLRRDVLGDGDMVRRFAREALAVAAVDSPHVVEVLAVGGEDAPLPFIAMERLEGEDLASRLRSVGRLPLREVVELVEQVAAGLGAAHEAGVVHRDLKPHNLFRTGGAEGAAPVWKILDFGVSKIAGSETLTRDGLVGTPGYMAPEQVDGGPVDRRADLHALSCIAYRALTGEPPFGGGEMARVLREIAEGMPRDPRALAGVSEEVTRALRVGLAKEPADRYPDAATLAEAFRDAARGELDARWRQRADALDARRPWQPAEASDVEVTRVVRGASTGR
ncbi:MAG TPA: serine/threonine-protein kinase, partial [Polyangiaceae bacterium LLY-WYZ-15_(1-7)]|nr:serine/threonine-protein kinase [Polyangiaceae bacterium LLY-WYZ-15_(1-7)]